MEEGIPGAMCSRWVPFRKQIAGEDCPRSERPSNDYFTIMRWLLWFSAHVLCQKLRNRPALMPTSASAVTPALSLHKVFKKMSSGRE